MVQVSESSLRAMARRMLVDMTERARWIYALPADPDTLPYVQAALLDAAIAEVDSGADGRVRRYQDGSGNQQILVFDHTDRDVVLIEARGEAAVPVMQRILERTGFVPQSQLWAKALDIGTADAVTSLSVLAHMVVAWDDDWADLFILHLASPDPIVRHEATKSLVVAAMVNGDVTAALELLHEAHGRERYPKLSDTMAESIRVLEAFSGQPASALESSETAAS